MSVTTTITEVEVTFADIEAAQRGEGWAQELVIGALGDRIGKIAGSEARKFYGQNWAELETEFRQVGNIAVWEALPRFDGTTVDVFYAFMFRTASTAITVRANEIRYPGADPDAIQVFAYWLKQTDGDLDLAERLCQRSADPIGRRLGRDRASAAKLAMMTTASLDAPFNVSAARNDYTGGEPVTYADLLVSPNGIPEEFLTSADLSAQERNVRIELVRAVLDSMGEISSKVLMMTYGIEPYGAFGPSANDEIGAVLGRTDKQVIDARTKGYRQFAKKFIPLVARSEAEAASWWDAFNAERSKSNVSTGKRAKANAE